MPGIKRLIFGVRWVLGSGGGAAPRLGGGGGRRAAGAAPGVTGEEGWGG